MKDTYFTRSATAPETIVAAVPQNTSWKKNFPQNGTEEVKVSSYADKFWPPKINKFSVPIKGLFPPNIIPQPRSRKPREDTANTIKFLDNIFTVFFALAKPASTLAKPKFIKKTRIAARNTHSVSIKEYSVIHTPPLNKIKQDKGATRERLCPVEDIILPFYITVNTFLNYLLLK